jgi:uncharacterized protein involved in exopolysaccharide biosynthesis
VRSAHVRCFIQEESGVIKMRKNYDNTVDIRSIGQEVFRTRKLIGFLLFLSVTCAVAASLIVPKSYIAEITLAHADASASGGVANSGLANLAGFAFGASDASDANLAVMTSRANFATLLNTGDFSDVLNGEINKSLLRTLGIAGGSENRDLLDLVDVLKKKIVVVREDKKTGLVYLSVQWSSAEYAAYLANEIVRVTNDSVRGAALNESNRKIEYLRNMLSSEELSGMQVAISAGIESELQTRMIIQGREEYAFKVIDAAMPPNKPASPNAAKWVLGSVCFSIALYFCWLLLYVVPRRVRVAE